jgi:hypothetical protein
MKYKVGQQVRIRNDIHEDMDAPGVTEEMVDMRGKVFTVKRVIEPEGWYALGNGYTWGEDMLKPITYTSDEAFESLLNGSLTDAEYEQVIKEIK